LGVGCSTFDIVQHSFLLISNVEHRFFILEVNIQQASKLRFIIR